MIILASNLPVNEGGLKEASQEEITAAKESDEVFVLISFKDFSSAMASLVE